MHKQIEKMPKTIFLESQSRLNEYFGILSKCFYLIHMLRKINIWKKCMTCKLQNVARVQTRMAEPKC